VPQLNTFESAVPSRKNWICIPKALSAKKVIAPVVFFPTVNAVVAFPYTATAAKPAVSLFDE
jgi:hypothetical protein